MTAGTRLEYEKRVNRAIDHVRAHLGEPLKLADLARVAAFSPFHFHRIFRALTGETLSAYVQRQRLERAAGLLAARPVQAFWTWRSTMASPPRPPSPGPFAPTSA